MKFSPESISNESLPEEQSELSFPVPAEGSFVPGDNIPANEYELSFSRSSGPGGQNVNKLNTKATIRFSIVDSNVLTDGQKDILLERLASRISGDGELVLECGKTRSQKKNKAEVISRLNLIINEALVPKKERIPTKRTPKSIMKGKRMQKENKRKKSKRMKIRPQDWK